jgi:hypothetical protein
VSGWSEAWARKALYLVVGWFGLVGPAVASMAITMYVNNDTNGSGGSAVFMTLLGIAFVVLAVLVLRPVLRTHGEPQLVRRRTVDGFSG